MASQKDMPPKFIVIADNGIQKKDMPYSMSLVPSNLRTHALGCEPMILMKLSVKKWKHQKLSLGHAFNVCRNRKVGRDFNAFGCFWQNITLHFKR